MNVIKFICVIVFVGFSSVLFASSGKDIFERYCIACHAQSMAPMFGSPAAYDVDAWTDRKNDIFDKAVDMNSDVANLSGGDKNNKIIELLVKSAIEGTDKGMPPMGTCMDCSDDDLKNAIEHMSAAA